MMKNLLKLKNLYMLIVIAALAYGGYYFGTQNTEDSTSSKTCKIKKTTAHVNFFLPNFKKLKTKL